MKIVLNTCYGGFGLSKEAMDILGGDECDWDYDRTNPKLIEVVEKLGAKAGDRFAELRVATIPDEATDWDINEYDGMETVIYVLDGKLRWDWQ